MSTWFLPLVEETTGNDFTNSENDPDRSVNTNTSDLPEPINYPAAPTHNPAVVNEPVNTPQHHATPWTPRIEEGSALGRSAVPTLGTPYWTLGGVPVPESWRPNLIANLDDIYLGNSESRPWHPPPPPPSACFGFVRAADGCPVYIPVPPGFENFEGDPIPERDSEGNITNGLPVLSEDDFLFPYELDQSIRRPITPTQYETMPVATRRQPSGTAEPVASRKTGFPAATGANKRKRPVVDDDPFASDDEKERGKGKRKSSVAGESDIFTVDLTEQAPSTEEKAADPKEDKRIKLGRFMCAICMDDVTNLTVTHCGHCFCLKCLHQSLYAETTRHRCPMCRTKVDMKARQEYTNKTKGFFPLELKLMTKTKKAKQPSSSASSSASSSFSSTKS